MYTVDVVQVPGGFAGVVFWLGVPYASTRYRYASASMALRHAFEVRRDVMAQNIPPAPALLHVA